ncbi:MAG: efflux RND transporter periplasmic adaptor subunit [Anaerolineaceae bacterium]|nr:efflux RND transporter periplasmic adaptor subunit [Anaerolineaceae bacterium]
MMSPIKSTFKRKPWLVSIPLVGFAVIAGLGFWFGKPGKADAGQAAYQTAVITRGNLSTDITGTGNLAAGRQVDLGFSTGGTIRSINIKLGGQVKTGQVLATLSEVDQLQNTLEGWQIKLKAAQKTLNDLLDGGDKTLAQALKELAAAKEAHIEAKKNLHSAGDGRCAQAKTEEYYYQYIYAQDHVNEWEDYLQYGNSGYGTNYILKVLKPMREERDKAYYNMKYCESYTEQEILQSQADLQLADAKLKRAEKVYQVLLANAGIDPVQVEIAQAQVENAKIQVVKARNDLDGAVITAPVDGTVVALDAEEGDIVVAINKIQNSNGDGTIYTSEFITISDLSTPYLEVSIDETDLQNFAAGCPAQVTFDALSNRTFSGEVSEVDPVLTRANGETTAHGLVKIKNAEMMPGKTLLLGLTGTAEIACSSVQDALLAPISAWYESSDGSSYVYVLNSSGLPEKRPVEIGLLGVAHVEIKSGLSEGDSVIISQVELDQTASS